MSTWAIRWTPQDWTESCYAKITVSGGTVTVSVRFEYGKLYYYGPGTLAEWVQQVKGFLPPDLRV